MSYVKKTFKGFIWNHFSKLSDYGLAYLFSIILARKLGTLDYSVYVTMMSIVSVALIIGSVGFDETLNKYVSQLSSIAKHANLRFLIRRLLTIRVGVLAVICVSLYLFQGELNRLFHNDQIAGYIVILVFYIFSQSIVNFLSNIFIAQLKTKFVFLVNIITKILNISLALFLLFSGYGLREILILLSAVSVGSLLAYFMGARTFFFGKLEPLSIKQMFNFSIAIWLNAFLAFTLGRYSNILMISYFFGTTEQSGFYEIAFSLTLLIEYVFAVGFTGVALSVFSELAVQDRSKLSEVRATLIKYLQVFIFPVTVFCMFYPEFVIKLLFSERYLPAVPLFRAFLSFNLISVSILGSGANTATLFALGKERVVLLNRAVFGFLNLIVNFFVIPIYGALGAIIITGACGLGCILVEFILTSRYVGLRYDVRFFLKVASVSVASALLVNFIQAETMASFLLVGALFVILIAFGYFELKLVDMTPQEMLRYIRVLGASK